MKMIATLVLVLLLAPMAFAAAAASLQPQDQQQRECPRQEPVLSVGGRGELNVRPDQATIVLGAVIQAEQASDAQRQVNAIMQRAFEQIRGLEIPEEAISTVGLSLEPVYSRQPPRGDQPHEPRIVGFRARNSIRVRIEDITRIGRVLDVGIAAGANQIQGLNFELQDDRRARQEALRRAVQDARLKAETISEAMGVRLEQVIEVAEADVGFRPPQPQMEMMRMAMDVGTPVQPGQIQIEAQVVVRYRIAGAAGN